MRIQVWAKMFKRKPSTGVLLCVVLVLAVITVIRLRQESPEGKHENLRTRTFSPVELSWPLPFSNKETSDRPTVDTHKPKRVAVNEEQLKRLKKVHPLYRIENVYTITYHS